MGPTKKIVSVVTLHLDFALEHLPCIGVGRPPSLSRPGKSVFTSDQLEAQSWLAGIHEALQLRSWL